MTKCCQDNQSISIKFKNPEVYKEFDHITQGDWIDLRVNDITTLKKGEFKLIDLGVAMELPDGYEAHVAPRSSSFSKYGIIQTNSVGVIDNSYCGDDDWWAMPVYPTRDVTLMKGTRICQFRIVKNQPKIEFNIVKELDNGNRGGFGSTGEK